MGHSGFLFTSRPVFYLFHLHSYEQNHSCKKKQNYDMKSCISKMTSRKEDRERGKEGRKIRKESQFRRNHII
jgi:hypothetical protein